MRCCLHISHPIANAIPALQMLASRRSLVYNSYDALAVQAYLRASGRSGRYKLSWTDTTVTEDWVVV